MGSALPLVSLEMIACPGARREEAALLHTLRTLNEKGTSFLTFFFLPKSHDSLPSGGIIAEDSVQLEKKGMSPISPKKMNHLSHYPDRGRLVVRLILQVQKKPQNPTASMFFKAKKIPST